MKKRFIYWCRWIAVLPGALFAGLVASFPLHWVLYSTFSNFIEPYPQLPERVLFPFIMAFVFIWAGSRIAPEKKTRTSLVLLSLWVLLAGYFFSLLFQVLIGWGKNCILK